MRSQSRARSIRARSPLRSRSHRMTGDNTSVARQAKGGADGYQRGIEICADRTTALHNSSWLLPSDGQNARTRARQLRPPLLAIRTPRSRRCKATATALVGLVADLRRTIAQRRGLQRHGPFARADVSATVRQLDPGRPVSTRLVVSPPDMPYRIDIDERQCRDPPPTLASSDEGKSWPSTSPAGATLSLASKAQVCSRDHFARERQRRLPARDRRIRAASLT